MANNNPINIATTSGSKATGVEFFGSDITLSDADPTGSVILIISFAASLNTNIQMTRDSSNFYALQDAIGTTTFISDTEYRILIVVRGNDEINFKQTTGTITFRHFNVAQLKA